ACVAVSGPVERVITLATGETDRGKNMWLFAHAALALLAEALAAA
ncbi:MAG TPA: damage-inducible protein, partial [Alphaproteobacteria bacterium]|nr:damage-inducible protein [Alphaproteobacteria bacterium]